ncbi:MAG: NUDIX hydrolase [Pseudomonadota bacterium]
MNDSHSAPQGAIRAGVGAVIFRGDEVLLIKRGKPPFMGHWSIPGGGIHYGESLEAAVHREVAEETGVTIEIIGLLKVYEFLPRTYPINVTDDDTIHEPGREAKLSGDPHFLMIDFVANWVSGEPVPGDDAADAMFLPLDDAIDRIGWDTTRTAVQTAAYRRAHNLLIR